MPRQPRRPQNRRQAGSRGTAPGRLRIVAGKWRGRRLPVIDAEGLRPTSERVRETLFNWLMHWVPGKRCLDLFAGTGALGFEALSREAASCVFVEKHRAAAGALGDNAIALDATTATVREGDAHAVLQDLTPASIDLAFLDPPFSSGGMSELCSLVADSGILADDARVYMEEPRDAPEARLPGTWWLEKTATAGNVRYSLVRTSGKEPE